MRQKIERLRVRFEKAMSNPEILQKSRGRPGTSTFQSKEKERLQRLKFDKNLCVFCQGSISSEDLHNVASKPMGLQIKDIAENTEDENIRTPLVDVIANADPLSAVAHDIKYH